MSYDAATVNGRPVTPASASSRTSIDLASDAGDSVTGSLSNTPTGSGRKQVKRRSSIFVRLFRRNSVSERPTDSGDGTPRADDDSVSVDQDHRTGNNVVNDNDLNRGYSSGTSVLPHRDPDTLIVRELGSSGHGFGSGDSGGVVTGGRGSVSSSYVGGDDRSSRRSDSPTSVGRRSPSPTLSIVSDSPPRSSIVAASVPVVPPPPPPLPTTDLLVHACALDEGLSYYRLLPSCCCATSDGRLLVLVDEFARLFTYASLDPGSHGSSPQFGGVSFASPSTPSGSGSSSSLSSSLTASAASTVTSPGSAGTFGGTRWTMQRTKGIVPRIRSGYFCTVATPKYLVLIQEVPEYQLQSQQEQLSLNESDRSKNATPWAITVARAIHAFSAAAPDTLDLGVGDLVDVSDREDPDWWFGRIGDRVGRFPRNCVEVVEHRVPHRTPLTYEVHLLDLETLRWSSVQPFGESPTFHSVPSIVAVRDSVYFIGGGDSGAPMMTVPYFNSLRMTWNRLNSSGDVPNWRVGHAIASVQPDAILMFGGFNPIDDACYNDLFILHVDSGAWRHVRSDGPTPVPRYGHAVCYADHRLYCFGGVTSKRAVVNELIIFDVDRLRWFRAADSSSIAETSSSSSAIVPRFGHQMIPFGAGPSPDILVCSGYASLAMVDPSVYARDGVQQDLFRLRVPRVGLNVRPRAATTLSAVASIAQPSAHASIQRSGSTMSPDARLLFEMTPAQGLTTPASGRSLAAGSSADVKGLNSSLGSLAVSTSESPSPSASPSPTPSPSLLSVDSNSSGPNGFGSGAAPSKSTVFEMRVDLSNFFFESADAQRDERNISTSVQNFLRSVYERHSPALGTPMMTKYLLRLVRIMSILDNGFTWEDINTIIDTVLRRTFGVHGDEPVQFEQFQSIMLLIAERKYRQAGLTPLAALNALISDHLFPYAMTALSDDESNIIEVLNPQVLSLFVKHRRKLREIFALYSTLDVLAMYAPTWNEVERHDSTVSLVEFLLFMEHFEVCPELVMRHIISGKLYPAALPRMFAGRPLEGELSFPYFLELLARIAVHVFQRHPYDSVYPTSRDKCKALFQHMGLMDREIYQRHVRSLGLRGMLMKAREAPNRDLRSSQEVRDTMNLDEIVSEPSRLERELRRVFEYYASFGNHLNTEFMSAGMWGRFVRDINITDSYRLTPAQADIICLRVTGERNASTVRMTYDHFVSALHVLAKNMPLDDMGSGSSSGSSSGGGGSGRRDLFRRLLKEHVLIYAAKTDIRRDEVDVNDPDIRQLLLQNQKALTIIFECFCRLGDSVGENWRETEYSNNTIDFGEFQKFARDFEICPNLISKTVLFRVFREANEGTSADDDASTLNFNEFQDTLVRIAHRVYSRYPYQGKYQSYAERLEVLFQRMQLYDVIKIRRKLEKLGYDVAPVSSAHTTTVMTVGGGATQGGSSSGGADSITGSSADDHSDVASTINETSTGRRSAPSVAYSVRSHRSRVGSGTGSGGSPGSGSGSRPRRRSLQRSSSLNSSSPLGGSRSASPGVNAQDLDAVYIGSPSLMPGVSSSLSPSGSVLYGRGSLLSGGNAGPAGGHDRSGGQKQKSLAWSLPSRYTAPPKSEWTRLLQGIFMYYGYYSAPAQGSRSNTYVSHRAVPNSGAGGGPVSEQGFLRMILDAHIFDNDITYGLVHKIYTGVTHDNAVPLSFDKFLEALSGISITKFPQFSGSDAYDELITMYVLPFAHTRTDHTNAQALAQHAAADTLTITDLVHLIAEYEELIRRVFGHYCALEPPDRTAPWMKAVNADQTISAKEFVIFCQDFDICPRLLTLPDLLNIHRLLSLTETEEEELAGDVSMPYFTMCLIRIAIEGFSVPPWCEQYETPREKLAALFRRMGFDDPQYLASILRRRFTYESSSTR